MNPLESTQLTAIIGQNREAMATQAAARVDRQISTAGDKGGDLAASRAAARAAAEDFEAVFLSVLVESMFSGVSTDGPFGGGQGETVFRSLMHQEYGRMLAENGGVGVSDAVYSEILKLQEGRYDE